MYIIFTYRIHGDIILQNTTIKKGVDKLKVIGIILIVWGVIGILLGAMMVGDIGVAAIVGAVVSILSGIGFILCNKVLRKLSRSGA